MFQTFQELLWVTAETKVLRAAAAAAGMGMHSGFLSFFFFFPNASSKCNDSFMHSFPGQIYGRSRAFDEE